jgi:hypothetical protein
MIRRPGRNPLRVDEGFFHQTGRYQESRGVEGRNLRMSASASRIHRTHHEIHPSFSSIRNVMVLTAVAAPTI